MGREESLPVKTSWVGGFFHTSVLAAQDTWKPMLDVIGGVRLMGNEVGMEE